MRIRPAETDDLPGIRAVGERTWPPTYAFAGSEYIANGLARWWSDAALAESLRNTRVLVVEDDTGELVGVGNLDLRGEVPHIWKLYVVPESHGTGTGAALLSALLELVPAEPGRVRLDYVDGNERATRFYARHDFVEVSRQPGDEPGWPDLVTAELVIVRS